MKFLLMLVSLPAAMAMHGTLSQRSLQVSQPSVKFAVIHLTRGLESEISGVIPHLPSDANAVARRGAAGAAVATPQSLLRAITAPASHSEFPASTAPASELAGLLMDSTVDEGMVPSLLDAIAWPGRMPESEVMRSISLVAPALSPSDHMLEALFSPAGGGEFIGLTADSSGASGAP